MTPRGRRYDEPSPAVPFASRAACTGWTRAHGWEAPHPTRPACAQPITLAVGPVEVEAAVFGARAEMLQRFPDGPRIPEAVARASVAYVCAHLRAAVYVLVRDSRLRLFVPFTAGNEFRNEWGAQLAVPASLLSRLPALPRDRWWTNSVILCNRPTPDVWGASFLCAYRHLIEAALAAGAVRDVEFILNKRDHPGIRLDRRHPYPHVWRDRPTAAAAPERLLPMLSPYVGDAYADVAIPLTLDYERALQRVFPGDGHALPAPPTPVAWADKRPVAFFRGSSTGPGTTAATNVRMKLATLARADFADVGITRLSRRLKVARGVVAVDADAGLPLAPYVPMREQARYKYLVVVDGNSAPNRVGALLLTGSLLLWVRSSEDTAGHRMWFYDRLEEGQHFRSVAADLADFEATVQWCRAHDAECAQMAARAQALARELFAKESIVAAMQRALRQC